MTEESFLLAQDIRNALIISDQLLDKISEGRQINTKDLLAVFPDIETIIRKKQCELSEKFEKL